MRNHLSRVIITGAALVATLTTSIPRPAMADTASTVAIAAGAAAIVGALLTDGNNRPYYVRNNHRYYVTQQEASYYRGHHTHYVQRPGYSRENNLPVARDPYHQGGMMQHGNMQHGNMQRGDMHDNHGH